MLPFAEHDPQDDGFFQRIEDLATAYWFSETLFAAVELGIFTLLDESPEGMSTGALSRRLRIKKGPLERFLNALCRMGLTGAMPAQAPGKNRAKGPLYFNSEAAGRYLVAGKEPYLGSSVLWRKQLRGPWAGLSDCLKKGGRQDFPPEGNGEELAARRRMYIDAMDPVARAKAAEIIPFLGSFRPEGELLDAGCGSGALAECFLEHAPGLKATLMDLPEILALARGKKTKGNNKKGEKGLSSKRKNFCAANMLEPWPLADGRFSLVVLSNVIHVYSRKELRHILKNAARCLAADGLLIVHDFFMEHRPEKAALFDLNMFINTINGMVFSYPELKEELARVGLCAAEPAPLQSDTALFMASRSMETLQKLRMDKTSMLIGRLAGLGFRKAVPISARDIHIPGWTKLRCRYGCGHYGEKQEKAKSLCPPYAPDYEETKNLVRDCREAVLLEGEPPAGQFQRKVLQAEKEAFLSGFYKAFSFWAGPCCLCPSCNKSKNCGGKNRELRRPSMEGAGIDVFETARRAGIRLKTISGREQYVKYFALLLLD